MPCPSMGPKWFWTVQIILVEFQLFWMCPICFGWDQIILARFKKSLIWTWPKWFGPDQNKLDLTETNWTPPKLLVLDQNDLDGPKSFWTHRRTRHYSVWDLKTVIFVWILNSTLHCIISLNLFFLQSKGCT